MAIMSILVSAIIAITLGAAYIAGLLDPVIEQVGVMFFRAKAKGEEKKMEARGMKEGQDFFEGTCCDFLSCCYIAIFMSHSCTVCELLRSN